MVLQRGVPLTVWGTASPGTKIQLTFKRKKFSAVAKRDSQWAIGIGQYPAGGPFEMTIQTSDTTIVLSDILIGDVWVCSGQSNMYWPLEASMNGPQDMKRRRPSSLRFLRVADDMEFSPLETLRLGTCWHSSDSPDLAKFSAVGYYFGKKLIENLNIPVGLIGSYWGGTDIESWMSTAAFKGIKEFSRIVAYVKNKKQSIKEMEAKRNTAYNDFIQNDYYKSTGLEQKWYLPQTDVKGWKPVNVPSLWDDAVPEMKGFHGEVWYRTSFDVPSEFAGKTLEFWIGQVNDHCMAWMNGEKVGERFDRTTWCGFEVDARILKATGNVLVVRIYNVCGKGGFSGNTAHFDYYPKGDRSVRLSTAGQWICKKGDSLQRPDGEFLFRNSTIGQSDYPTCIFNAMIHPLVKFPIKGVIWYQGENNVTRAYQYRTLFPALINDWRKQWGLGDFPFYFVQLANFMERNSLPTESDWAELREAQSLALSLPHTGMATAIDIGDAKDIHPTNKHDVGKRLALHALKTTYHKNVVPHGPMFKSMKIHGNQAIVSFDACAHTLVTSDKKMPASFALAGADRKFHFANAKIEKNKIILTCDQVERPVAARYAWANNPAINLYNQEGLPAVPFRTDDWPGITVGKT